VFFAGVAGLVPVNGELVEVGDCRFCSLRGCAFEDFLHQDSCVTTPPWASHKACNECVFNLLEFLVIFPETANFTENARNQEGVYLLCPFFEELAGWNRDAFFPKSDSLGASWGTHPAYGREQ